MPIKLIKILKIFLTYLPIFFFTSAAYAQETEPPTVDIDGDFSFKWFELPIQFDLTNFGILNVAGFLVMFIVAWMILYTFWLAIKVAWTAIRSRGETDDVEKGAEMGRELWKGILVSFMWMAIYIVISLWLGVGNLFVWPQTLTQCGDGAPYFQAEYNAQQLLKENGYSFNQSREFSTFGYCCPSAPLLYGSSISFSKVKMKDGELSNEIYGRFSSTDNITIVNINLDQNEGGWLFVNTKENIKDNVGKCKLIF